MSLCSTCISLKALIYELFSVVGYPKNNHCCENDEVEVSVKKIWSAEDTKFDTTYLTHVKVIFSHECT